MLFLILFVIKCDFKIQSTNTVLNLNHYNTIDQYIIEFVIVYSRVVLAKLYLTILSDLSYLRSIWYLSCLSDVSELSAGNLIGLVCVLLHQYKVVITRIITMDIANTLLAQMHPSVTRLNCWQKKLIKTPANIFRIVMDSNIFIIRVNCGSIIDLMQFTIKMNVNSSVLLIFSAVYPITLMMINILSTASIETIDGTFFQLVFGFSKTQTKHTNSNDRQLIMTQYAMLWQLSIYFKYFEGNWIQIRSNNSSIRKELVDISNIHNDNKNSFFRIFIYNKFLFFCSIRILYNILLFCQLTVYHFEQILQCQQRRNQRTVYKTEKLLWLCCRCLIMFVDCCSSPILIFVRETPVMCC